jgi:hypothetical protein
MKKQNCWEFWRCAEKADSSLFEGPDGCPVMTAEDADGINGGYNGGRSCWAIVGTLSPNVTKRHHAGKTSSCLQCAFYQAIQTEEGDGFFAGSELALHLLERTRSD